MSVDWLIPSKLLHRLDARYYGPEYIAIEESLDSSPYGWDYLGAFIHRIFKGAFYVLAEEYTAEGVPFIRVADINAGYVDLSRCVYLSPELHQREAKTQVHPGTLLIAKSGELRHCAIVPDFIPEANISQDLVGVTLRTERIDPHFLQAFLADHYGYDQMTRGIQGNAHPHISNDEFKLIRIPLAPKPNQCAVGLKLRAAERLRQTAARTLADAVDRLGNQFNVDDFSGLTPNASGDCDFFAGFVRAEEMGHFHGAQFHAPKRKQAVQLVRSTSNSDRIGVHGKRVRAKAKRNSKVMHVDPSHLESADGYWTAGENEEGGDVALAKPGHVLFLRMRPYLNKTTINDTDQTVSASPEFLIYRFDERDAYYAALCLRQPWALAQVAEIATGDRPRVDGEFVDEVVIPWPDQDTREEIGNLYRSSFALRRRADILVQQAIADVENLIDGKLDEAECLRQGKELAQEFGLEVPQ